MLKPPLIQPFCFGVVFSPFAGVELAAGFLDVTNAQKLALAGGTAVGTVVHVSDGFVVSGTGWDGVFFKIGTANGKDYYSRNGVNVAAGDDVTVSWDGANWIINGEDSSTEDVAYPWLVTAWLDADINPAPGITLTHPAVQQLAIADPSDEAHWTNI